MVINIVNFSDIIGKKLSKVLIKYDKLMKDKNILLAEEIRFCFERDVFILSSNS